MQQTCSSSGLAVRWYARLAMLLSGTVLALLAFEPYGQAWLAWFALTPFLLVIAATRSLRAAFAWGWLAGVLFFASSIWWLWRGTIPGAVLLISYLGLHWAVAATIIRGLGLPELQHGWGAATACFLIAAVWVATEWFRAYRFLGFPWLLIGHSQSPWPVLCQIADVASVFGIGFCVMLVNAFVALAITRRRQWRALGPAALAVGMVVLAVVVYGVFRLSEDAAYPGPRVMVVQPNHPHLRGGARVVSREDVVAFHIKTTYEALGSESPDLVVWSETAMPPLNLEARQELRTTRGGETMERTHGLISELTRSAGTSLVTGAYHVGGWTQQGAARVGTEIRNSVYLYSPDGRQAAQRYDRTQLVPFGETVAFADSVPWLHRALLWLAPPTASQEMVSGDRRTNPVFTVQNGGNIGETAPADHPTARGTSPGKFRFITPICLENIDPALIAGMIRDPEGQGKRADFLVNVSNDGWFHPIERAQHFQNVILRSIENRVPTARASNTGISGFIDSAGRVLRTIPPGTDGTATSRLMLDRRITFYTRHGDVFAGTCVAITVAAILVKMVLVVRGRWKRDAVTRGFGGAGVPPAG